MTIGFPLLADRANRSFCPANKLLLKGVAIDAGRQEQPR